MFAVYRFFQMIGFDPRITVNFVRGIGFYCRDLFKFLRQKKGDRNFSLRLHPIVGDRYDYAGVMTGHYFHQDLLVARRIFENRPVKHVDVGSRIDGFVAHVAAFRKIELFDMRELRNTVPNIETRRVDFMQVNPALDDYCDSISSLHAIEHFGLGRYGDSVNFNGHRRGLENIHRMLQDGGRFYFSVPIGPQRIEFNAHRVFSVNHLLELFEGRFRVDTFHYVDDAGELHENTPLKSPNAADNFGCKYGCGIFELIRI